MRLADIQLESSLDKHASIKVDYFRTNGIYDILSNSYINSTLQVLFHMFPLLTKIQSELRNDHETIQLVQFYRAFSTKIPTAPFKYLTVRMIIFSLLVGIHEEISKIYQHHRA